MAANPQIRSVEVEKGGVLVTLYVPMRNPTSPIMDALGLTEQMAVSGTGVATGGRRRASRGGRAGPRGGQTKAGMVLDAVRAGARTPKEITEATGLENKQVHAYLSYHAKKGNMKRDEGEWEVLVPE